MDQEGGREGGLPEFPTVGASFQRGPKLDIRLAIGCMLEDGQVRLYGGCCSCSTKTHPRKSARSGV